ncbi:hypothetical protein [Nostoc sp.]|uniref:hypothetical protein n=1 Tax=Nostoc sp. TaxID=1180 RepID=UPI002FFAF862
MKPTEVGFVCVDEPVRWAGNASLVRAASPFGRSTWRAVSNRPFHVKLTPLDTIVSLQCFL